MKIHSTTGTKRDLPDGSFEIPWFRNGQQFFFARVVDKCPDVHDIVSVSVSLFPYGLQEIILVSEENNTQELIILGDGFGLGILEEYLSISGTSEEHRAQWHRDAAGTIIGITIVRQ